MRTFKYQLQKMMSKMMMTMNSIIMIRKQIQKASKINNYKIRIKKKQKQKNLYKKKLKSKFLMMKKSEKYKLNSIILQFC